MGSKKNLKYFFLTLFSIGIISIIFPTLAFATSLETGGTNYILYDLGAYGENPTPANWTKLDYQGGMKTALGAYDLDPDRVKSQLNAMCQSGQKKIGFMIWHSRFAPYPQTIPLYGNIADQVYPVDPLGFYTNSANGKLQPRQENNLRSIIDVIAKQRCFNEIQFRFSPTWYSFFGNWGDPTDWTNPTTGWNEPVYLENFAFVKFVRNIIRTTLASNNSPIKVYFDLGAETGGMTYEWVVADSDPLKNVKVPYYNNMIEMYQKRIWSDYTREFGIDDTYGFSIALAPGRFARLMALYNAVGIHPEQHAIDIYDIANTGMTAPLTTLFSEMQQTNQSNAPILIQETYFNDQLTFEEIIQAKNALGINIRTVMQWQLDRSKSYRPDGQLRHFSTIDNTYRYFGPKPGLPTEAPAQAGDLNADGVINLFDYNLLVSLFGNPYTIFDYNTLVGNYGT